MKGILFKPDMIQAIVDGRKTQTRRKIDVSFPDDRLVKPYNDEFVVVSTSDTIVGLYPIKPRYQPGEVVYIKEALYRHPYLDEAGYLVDQTPVFINQTIGDCLKWRWYKDKLSSMFMPQEAARHFITITDVRVERLQEITREDARAEGMRHEGYWAGDTWHTSIGDFHYLWNSINKPPYDWNSNCWVWVYSFKKVEV